MRLEGGDAANGLTALDLVQHLFLGGATVSHHFEGLGLVGFC